MAGRVGPLRIAQAHSAVIDSPTRPVPVKLSLA